MYKKDDVLREILRSADKHPNSRVSKLIHSLETAPTQKDIALLIIEIAEHAEYVTDFGISLKYYLDLFEDIGSSSEILLNETGLVLVNSSKIYSRRVDYVHDLIHNQILSLSNADNETANSSDNQESSNVNKVKGRRKRLLEMPQNPYEVEMMPKKIRKISAEKRFSATLIHQQRRKESRTSLRKIEIENHIHPTTWTNSNIVDLENEDEIDSKRNYKLFTHHVEHRYNTLIPDINFRLHFMVKDFIDEEEELLEAKLRDDREYSANQTRTWPPLSEEYVTQYLNLENKIFKSSATSQRNGNISSDCTMNESRNNVGETFNVSSLLSSTRIGSNESNTLDVLETGTDKGNISLVNKLSEPSANTEKNLITSESLNANKNETIQHDSGLGNSMLEPSNVNTETAANVKESEAKESNNNAFLREEGTNCIDSNIKNKESASLTENSSEHIETVEKGNSNGNKDKENNNKDEINLNEIRIHLPHLDDEGVYFSDLDENEHRMLSPTVMATDVFPQLPNKKNLTIIIDDELRSLLNLKDDQPETYEMPSQKCPKSDSVTLNIMKIDERMLKRKRLFKLGTEFTLFMQAFTLKRSRPQDALPQSCAPKQMKWFRLNGDNEDDDHGSLMFMTDAGSMSEFYGFSDSSEHECGDDSFLGHRLSNDSGVDDVENQAKNLENAAHNKGDEHIISGKIIHLDGGADNLCSASENNCVPTLADNTPVDKDVATNSCNINLTSTKSKIQKWHEYLQPILAKSRERHHFNIFQLGTEIMNEIDQHMKKPQECVSKKSNVSFQEVMENKDPSYVSRYFLSSLLLANQGNIKITIEDQHSEYPSEWKDIKLQVLSRKRHTVSIEDNVGVQEKRSPQTLSMRWKSGLTKSQEERERSAKVTLDSVMPLEQIEKIPASSDDYDSGIFSSEEIT